MGKRRNPLTRAAVSGLSVGFLWVTARTPLSLNRAVARPIGRLLACLVPRVRRVTLANLDRAYGDTLTRAEKRKIFWGVVDNIALMAAEFGHVQRISRGKSDAMITVEGAEHVERNRGYLCIGAHMGNWELMPHVMASRGYKVAGVVRHFDAPAVDRAIDRTRTEGGIVTIFKDNAGRAIFQRLKEGFLVGILVDQSPRDNGVPVTFFGEPCWATVAPVMIAVRAKAPVLPVALTRSGPGRFTLRFYPPLEMERTGDPRADLVRNTQRCQDAIEQMVRETPEQWLWLHRRWKERPRLAEAWERRSARDHKGNE